MFLKFFKKLKRIYFKYEKVFLSFAFFIGIFWDNFTLRRIDRFYENSVFAWSFLQIFLIVILLNLNDSGRLRARIWGKILPVLPAFMQFSFGNLFSGLIIFYIRSGSILVSWPFVLILGGLFLGNEFFRKRYLHIPFQMGVFFTALFSYSVFLLPVLTNKMGSLIFLLSGLCALLATGLILVLIFFIMPSRIKVSLKSIIAAVGGIYLAFQILYFANVIPPVPLSIKESGIYHSIDRVNIGGFLYRASFEPEKNPYLFFKDQSDTFHLVQGSAIYYYTAIFSPADLNAQILHRWSYFDQTKNKWVEKERLGFEIIGGRVSGYRGYSYILDAFPGKWRVDAINAQGQVLGRRTFNVVQSQSVPLLDTVLR